MKLINVDIAVNLTDGMFRGIYRQATAAVHASDLHLVVGQRARQFGVERAIITCTHLQEIPQSLQLIINNNNGHVDESIKLFTTVGVHPTRCGEFESAEHHSTSNLSINERADAYYKKLEEYIQQDQQQDHKSKKIVAIGECGLDWDRVEFCSKALQLKYFIKQLNLSKKYNLPLFLHNRGCGTPASENAFIQTLREHKDKLLHNSEIPDLYPGVVHSFDGTLEEAQILMNEFNLFIGINGCSLKTAENIAVVKEIPLEKIMIETDAPWCDIRPTHASYPFLTLPVTTLTSNPDIQHALTTALSLLKSGCKKKDKFVMGELVKGRNEPGPGLLCVLAVVSGIKGLDMEVVAKQVRRNTMACFFPGEEEECEELKS